MYVIAPVYTEYIYLVLGLGLRLGMLGLELELWLGLGPWYRCSVYTWMNTNNTPEILGITDFIMHCTSALIVSIV